MASDAFTPSPIFIGFSLKPVACSSNFAPTPGLITKLRTTPAKETQGLKAVCAV